MNLWRQAGNEQTIVKDAIILPRLAPTISPTSLRFVWPLPMPSFFSASIQENLYLVVRRELPPHVGVEV